MIFKTNCWHVTSVNTEVCEITAPPPSFFSFSFEFYKSVSALHEQAPKASLTLYPTIFVFMIWTLLCKLLPEKFCNNTNESFQNCAFSFMSIWTAQGETEMLCTNIVKKGWWKFLFFFLKIYINMFEPWFILTAILPPLDLKISICLYFSSPVCHRVVQISIYRCYSLVFSVDFSVGKSRNSNV